MKNLIKNLLLSILILTIFINILFSQEVKTINIVEAIQKGLIDVDIRGAGLENVELTITKKTSEPLKIVIPVGTFFENRGDEQDMVATKTTTVDLTTNKEVKVSVPSACVDIERDVPESHSKFNIYISPKSEDLKKLMSVLEKESYSNVVKQVAIWIITNDVNREELDSIYIVRTRSILNPFFVTTRPAATNDDVIIALMLLEKAGINISNKRIVRERISAIKGLSSTDKKVYEYSAKLLGYKGEKDLKEFVIETICRLLKDSDRKIRKTTGEVAENFKDDRIIETLIDGLKDTNSDVRKAVSESLKKLTGQDFGEDYEKWKKWWDENKKKIEKSQLEDSSKITSSSQTSIGSSLPNISIPTLPPPPTLPSIPTPSIPTPPSLPSVPNINIPTIPQISVPTLPKITISTPTTSSQGSKDEKKTITTWQKVFGGENYDEGFSIKQTKDGGYIIVGYTESFNAKKKDFYILKIDSEGNISWQKVYGDWDKDIAYSVELIDNDILVLGESFITGPSTNMLLLKLDSSGKVLIKEELGDNRIANYGYCISATNDKGYVIAGTYGSNIYILKFNSIGKLQWEKIFGKESVNLCEPYCIKQTNDGGYIIVGMVINIFSGDSDIIVVKLNNKGDLQWNKVFGGDESDRAYSILQTKDGGYILTGFTKSFGKTSSDIIVIKLDLKGDIEWANTYDNLGWEEGYSIVETKDGGYIVVGGTLSVEENIKAYIIKIDEKGRILWTKTYSGIKNAILYSIIPTDDGGYIAVGKTSDSVNLGASMPFSGKRGILPLAMTGNTDIFVIKMDENGNASELKF